VTELSHTKGAKGFEENLHHYYMEQLLPIELKKTFGALVDIPVLWMGYVTKVNKVGKKQIRVLVLLDECLFSCSTDGEINRCVSLGDVNSIETFPNESCLLLHISSEYDMMFSTTEWNTIVKEIRKRHPNLDIHQSTTTSDKVNTRRLQRPMGCVDCDVQLLLPWKDVRVAKGKPLSAVGGPTGDLMKSSGAVPLLENITPQLREPGMEVAREASRDLGGITQPQSKKDFQERLHTLYSKYCPEKIGLIPQLLEMYAGKEEEILNLIVEKYGAEPVRSQISERDPQKIVIQPSTSPDEVQVTKRKVTFSDDEALKLKTEGLNSNIKPSIAEEPSVPLSKYVISDAPQQPQLMQSPAPNVATPSFPPQRSIHPLISGTAISEPNIPRAAYSVPPETPPVVHGGARTGQGAQVSLNAATGPSSQGTPLAYRTRLVNIYEKYNPEKVANVDYLLQNCAGREEELIAALVDKWGPEPIPRSIHPLISETATPQRSKLQFSDIDLLPKPSSLPSGADRDLPPGSVVNLQKELKEAQEKNASYYNLLMEERRKHKEEMEQVLAALNVMKQSLAETEQQRQNMMIHLRNKDAEWRWLRERFLSGGQRTDASSQPHQSSSRTASADGPTPPRPRVTL